MSQQLQKIRRIAYWLEAGADGLTPAEIRMAAQHVRDLLDGKPLDMGVVAGLQSAFRRMGGGPPAPG